MDSASTLQLLLNEAQQEIASLRSDLYNQRRVAEERRQAVQSLTTERDGLHAHVQQLDSDLVQCRAQLNQLQGVQQQLQSLQEAHAKLQRDVDLSQQARKILQAELADERKQRQMIEDAKASLEAERSRQVKAKDDLAAALRMAQRKAAEAEEEQLRAEEEAAALRAELESLHASGSHGDMDRVPHGASAAPAPAADWQEQLEYERNRAATLLSSLHAAKAEIAALSQQLNSQGLQAGEAQQLHAETVRLKQQLSEATSTSQTLRQQLTEAQAAHQAALAAAALASSQSSQHTAANNHSQPAHPHDQHHNEAHGYEAASSSALQASGSHVGPTQSSAYNDSNGHALVPYHQRHSTAGSGSQLGTDLAAVEKLQDQVAKLKGSRDKLLAQIDKQWEEMDRLAAEHKSVADELERARAVAEGWEAQAQDGLAHVERLKEMLEEAASWSSGQGGAGGGGGGAANPYMAAVNGTSASPQAMEAALLSEKARSAELELHLRALAAELLRSQQASMSIGRAVLPVLSGIEYRLTDMFSKAQVQQAQLQAAPQTYQVTA